MSAPIQVRVTGPGKVPDRVHGPDDAAVVVMVGSGDVALDPTIAFMQGRLKATGHTGVLFDALASGAVAAGIAAALDG